MAIYRISIFELGEAVFHVYMCALGRSEGTFHVHTHYNRGGYLGSGNLRQFTAIALDRKLQLTTNGEKRYFPWTYTLGITA